MKRLYFIPILLLGTLIAQAQSYGGKVKLKFTYEDTPLAGYDITTSINNVEIRGGRGVTDADGVVELNTEPLPIPNIDVKGVINCNNSEKSFEASGYVYVSQSSNNYYHLDLKNVATQMSEMSGMSIDVFMESFGVNCLRGGGSSGKNHRL